MITGLAAKRSMPERILLVDDNELGLRARKVVLEELGYQVTAIGCGIEALHQFGRQVFDLVITDYKMPNLDGIQLIARIREQKPGVPVVLISGFAEALGLTDTNTGADIVIQKSCHEISALTRAVDRLLTRPLPRKPLRSQTSVARRSAAAQR
jgi:CheY-like chemotaxis protein